MNNNMIRQVFETIKWTLFVALMLVLLMILISGCRAEQQTKVWGKGELRPDWIEFFGDNNTARLDFAQSQMLDRHQVLLIGMDVKDANGQTVHRAGLVDYVLSLDNKVKSLESRIEALEDAQLKPDPNEGN